MPSSDTERSGVVAEQGAPVVVRVADVSKRFVLRKEKSLKERLVNFGRSQKNKEDFWALRNVSLDISAGSTIGLIGPNGSGKSTLLKTIGGIIQPSSGTVERRGRLAALLELGAGFHPDLTGRENVFLNASILGISRKETEQYFDSIVEFAGIGEFIDTQVKFYSSGMYVRLAFAVAVHVDPDVLIVDEVLAVGDEPFQRKCMERIRSFQRAGKTIILVTHSLDLVGEFCDRAVVLESGHIVFDGDPGEALARLRQDFEEMRAPVAEVQMGQRIRGVRVLALDGAQTDLAVPGQPLVIEVDVEPLASDRDWFLGMGIETGIGHHIYGTNFEMLGVPFRGDIGPTTVRFDLGPAHLHGGQYFVHVSFASAAAGEIERVEHAASLNVRNEPNSVGVVSFAPVGVEVSSGRTSA